jgi:hypothetical protein
MFLTSPAGRKWGSFPPLLIALCRGLTRERSFLFFRFRFRFLFVFVFVYVNDNVDDRASCLVPQRLRRVASVDVDAALPRGPTLIRGFFFKPWPARTSAVLKMRWANQIKNS